MKGNGVRHAKKKQNEEDYKSKNDDYWAPHIIDLLRRFQVHRQNLTMD